jgi:hypothetical protein
MQSVVMLSVVMLSVVMLSVIMLGVLAPCYFHLNFFTRSLSSACPSLNKVFQFIIGAILKIVFQLKSFFLIIWK